MSDGKGSCTWIHWLILILLLILMYGVFWRPKTVAPALETVDLSSCVARTIERQATEAEAAQPLYVIVCDTIDVRFEDGSGGWVSGYDTVTPVIDP
ncbi:hypothetical protein ACFL3S_08545 [Gemmatimonadota bacterium]